MQLPQNPYIYSLKLQLIHDFCQKMHLVVANNALQTQIINQKTLTNQEIKISKVDSFFKDLKVQIYSEKEYKKLYSFQFANQCISTTISNLLINTNKSIHEKQLVWATQVTFRIKKQNFQEGLTILFDFNYLNNVDSKESNRVKKLAGLGMNRIISIIRHNLEDMEQKLCREYIEENQRKKKQELQKSMMRYSESLRSSQAKKKQRGSNKYCEQVKRSINSSKSSTKQFEYFKKSKFGTPAFSAKKMIKCNKQKNKSNLISFKNLQNQNKCPLVELESIFKREDCKTKMINVRRNYNKIKTVTQESYNEENGLTILTDRKMNEINQCGQYLKKNVTYFPNQNTIKDINKQTFEANDQYFSQYLYLKTVENLKKQQNNNKIRTNNIKMKKISSINFRNINKIQYKQKTGRITLQPKLNIRQSFTKSPRVSLSPIYNY